MAEMKNASKEEIIIAAWLHNIGYYAKDDAILDKIVKTLPQNVDKDTVCRLIQNWKNPTVYDEQLIIESDRLSHGDAEFSDDKFSDFFNNPVPLQHLVSTLQIPERAKPNIAYCQFKPLEADGIIPVSDMDSNYATSSYQGLWRQFESDFLKLEGLEFDDYLKALNSLLERYWWCIPSSSCSESESLYQHAKLSAAIAAVLFEYHKETNSETIEALKDDPITKFRFFKGDVSGIQKYIFDLKTTKHNAKLLRAKSFQLVALSEILSQYLVKQFEVSYANIIMSAGGNFMLFVPNTEKANHLLPQIQLEIESYFLREFAGKLAVIVSDGVVASGKDLRKENIVALMNRIGENADRCKQKKMQKALSKHGAVLHDFYTRLQQYGECPKCGIFPASGIDSDSNHCECFDCKNLTEIGGNLVRAGTVVLDSSKLRPFAQMVKVSPKGGIPGGYTVNDFIPGKPVMYIPYTAPTQDGEVLTFEEISDRSTGIAKLAMFKSDIDNLGLVFSSSLGAKLSFSRYADLSHLLHYFFSAYYADFVRTHNYQKGETAVKYDEVIYTVFSGGDDLCILGAWDAIVQFAADFEEELQKFTNVNASLSLSGGITLASSLVPVRNIAVNAEENLETSKARKEHDKIAKNGMTVFETTVSWKDYRKCLADGKQLENYLSRGTISTGTVYKLLDFARRAERVQKGDVKDLLNMRNQTWKSNFKYIAVRNIKDKAAFEWFLHFGASPEEMIKSRIAVSYALYTQRKN